MHSRLTSILEAIKETLESSSFQSVPNIIRNKFITIKLMWIFCLMCALASCAYFICAQVSDYLNFDVVSSIKQVYRSPISFPVITICNLFFFATNVSNTDEELSMIFHDANQSYFTANISEKMKFFHAQTAAIVNSNFINKTIRDQLGYSLNQTLISCVFKNNDCSLEEDFIEYFDPLYGRCFQFNSDNSKTILLSGSLNGLQLELFMQSAESNINKYSFNNGFYIFIGNDKSFNTYNIDGVFVSAGSATNIALIKQSFRKQPKPYSNCVADLVSVDSYPSEVYKHTFVLHNKFYTRDFCLNMCFQLDLKDKCGCYDVTSGPFPSNLRPCLNETDMNCDNNAWSQFLNQSSCDCPYECDKINYSYTTSISEYPTKTYADHLLKNSVVQYRFGYRNDVRFEEVKSSTMSINIFYNELFETTFSEEIKITVIDLVSNIGGILGLFTGAGFLSFIEFAEILFQSIFIFFEKKRPEPQN